MGEHVPKFQNYDDEVDYWDKTSVEDLSPDVAEEVEVERPQSPLSSTFAVRLDQRTVERLREVAAGYHLGPTQLVRAWILERIQIEIDAGVLAEHRSRFAHAIEVMLRKKIVEGLMKTLPKVAEATLDEVDESAIQDVLERTEVDELVQDRKSEELADA